MHGKGKLYYPSGRLAYDGVFKYDKFHDHGKLYN
jgi:antitoxin component YwqK of YwqJK toxin-antitoxin module